MSSLYRFLKVAHSRFLLMKCPTLYQRKIKSYPLTSQYIRIKLYPLTIEESNSYLWHHCQVLHCHYEKTYLAKVTFALSKWLYGWSYGKLPCLTVSDLQLWQFHMVQHNRSRFPFFSLLEVVLFIHGFYVYIKSEIKGHLASMFLAYPFNIIRFFQVRKQKPE